MSRIVIRKLKVIHDLKIDFSNIITRNEMLEFKIFGIFKKTFPIKCYFSEKFTNLFFISQFYWKFSKFSNKEIYCTGISGIEVRSLIDQREMLISIYSLLKSLISKFYREILVQNFIRSMKTKSQFPPRYRRLWYDSLQKTWNIALLILMFAGIPEECRYLDRETIWFWFGPYWKT